MDSQALTSSHRDQPDRDRVGFRRRLRFLQTNRMPRTTHLFLLTTFLTSLTGFLFFKRDQPLPSHITGVIALVVLVPTCLALYTYKLAGASARRST